MKHFYEYLIYAGFVSYILSEKLKRVIVVDEKKAVVPHRLIIDGRKNISVTGVTEADNFSDEEIILYTSCGQITIKGEDLQISVLNTEHGDVTASGKVNSVSYSDRSEKHQSFFSKVFR